jgi:ABC-2 type transport system ATP-binding protein
VQFIVTVVHEPTLLILDEPFTGFDPINANLIKDELLAMKEKGVSIILSTHRMESVEELCTHIALINKSKKLLEGPVRDIRRSYRNNIYELEFDSSAGLPDLGDVMVLKKEPHGDLTRITVKLASPQDTNPLLQRVIPQVSIQSFREVLPSMNDIFIQNVSQANPDHE